MSTICGPNQAAGTWLPTDDKWEREGSIVSSSPAWWNDERDFPAGRYRIKYERGAFRFSAAHGWSVGENWRIVTRQGVVTVLFDAPSMVNPIVGRSSPNKTFQRGGFDTQGGAENWTRQSRPYDFDHTGGPLGIILLDNPYGDNKHGSPDPVWSITKLEQCTEPEPEPTPPGSGTGTGTGTTGPSECPKETPQIGLLSANLKGLLDGLGSHPGGFGFIFKPGTFLTVQDGPDSVLSGEIELRSGSFTITCLQDQLDGDVRNIFKFDLSQDWLDSFCVEVKGDKGPKGEKGPKGQPGRHGTGDGPLGAPGPDGKDALAPATFTGVKVIESDDVYDVAVIDLKLDPENSILEVIKSRMAVPDNDTPTSRVAASPIFRDIAFSGEIAVAPRDSDGQLVIDFGKWDIQAGTGDPVNTVDINIIRLPAGWSGGQTGAVPVIPMRLSELIQSIIDVYGEQALCVLKEWDKQTKEFIAAKDKEARQILAELAQELTESEWSAPIEFCVDITRNQCGDPGSGAG